MTDVCSLPSIPGPLPLLFLTHIPSLQGLVDPCDMPPILSMPAGLLCAQGCSSDSSKTMVCPRHSRGSQHHASLSSMLQASASLVPVLHTRQGQVQLHRVTQGSVKELGSQSRACCPHPGLCHLEDQGCWTHSPHHPGTCSHLECSQGTAPRPRTPARLPGGWGLGARGSGLADANNSLGTPTCPHDTQGDLRPTFRYLGGTGR
jgi:hypothetical protein